MYTVGVTGGICSGKTYICAYISKKYKVPFVNCDVLVRELQRKGTRTYIKIVREFGSDILRRDFRINRRKLGRIVFSDAKKRKRLDKIVHPEVKRLVREKKIMYSQKQKKIILVEVPLLFEAGMKSLCDTVVCVSVSLSVQVQRVMAKFNIDSKDALSRISSQMSLEDKMRRSNFIVKSVNSNTRVNREADRLWQKLNKQIV